MEENDGHRIATGIDPGARHRFLAHVELLGHCHDCLEAGLRLAHARPDPLPTP
jgi:hypothetical protein